MHRTKTHLRRRCDVVSRVTRAAPTSNAVRIVNNPSATIQCFVSARRTSRSETWERVTHCGRVRAMRASSVSTRTVKHRTVYRCTVSKHWMWTRDPTAHPRLRRHTLVKDFACHTQRAISSAASHQQNLFIMDRR